MAEPMIVVWVVLAFLGVFLLIAVGYVFMVHFIVRVVREDLAGQRTDLFNALKGMGDRIGGVDNRLNQSLTDIGTKLGGMMQITDQVLGEQKKISSFQEMLRSPKVRGGFGEMMLNQLLEQVLAAENFTVQYPFADGKIVDAVIRLGSRLVPVDAKFPLDNFSRMLEADSDDEKRKSRRAFVTDVRKHIENVAQYIRPDEGTFDFAMMYIPAESVYYETIVKSDFEIEKGKGIQEFALAHRVFTVSPNSFYGYLGAIVYGLRGMQVEKRAEQILGHLQRLQGDFGNLKSKFGLLGDHLRHARNTYEEVDKAVQRHDERLAVSFDVDEPTTRLIEK